MIKKKRRVSPTEIIAMTTHPELEAGYIKTGGHRISNVSGKRNPKSIKSNPFKIRKYREGSGWYAKVSSYHTHPGRYELRSENNPNFRMAQTCPSIGDIVDIIECEGTARDYTWIVQRDEKTGAISGYLLLKPKKRLTTAQDWNRKKLLDSFNLIDQHQIDNTGGERTSQYLDFLYKEKKRLKERIFQKPYPSRDKADLIFFQIDKIKEALRYFTRLDHLYIFQKSPESVTRGLAEEFGLYYKFIPVSPNHPSNIKSAKRLESKALTFSIIAIFSGILALFFVSKNLTGNTIGNLNNLSINILWVCLLVLCLGGIILYRKTKKKHSKLIKQLKKSLQNKFY